MMPTPESGRRVRDAAVNRDGASYDVAIIGAGINGCTAARMLAAEGFNVLLVDKADLGGAATRRSGRTLHCGLQLLAPRSSLSEFLLDPGSLVRRVRLARRAARDYAELCAAMPERLRPMEVAVPLYEGVGYGGWHVDVGARLIRLFGGRRMRLAYRRWQPHARSSNPFAVELRDQDKITSVVSFVDQRIEWPERIAIDAALDAERMGATIRTYTELRALTREADHWHLELHELDRLPPQATARAKLVVNLAGAWVDQVAGITLAGHANAARKVEPVKGVYILVRLPGRYKGHGIAAVNRLGEPITCLPWGDLHYIGPTETPYEGDLDDVVPEDEDVAFLLEEFSHLLPGLRLGRDDILMAWAGVRPITYAPGHPKGARMALNVLHDLGREGYPNMLALSWGIIANHRSTGRAVVSAVRRRIRPSGPRQSGPSRRPDIQASDASPIERGCRDTAADLRFCVQHEHARDLVGVLFSRTGLAWTGDLTSRTVDVAADAIGPLLGWDDARRADEIAAFRNYLLGQHWITLR